VEEMSINYFSSNQPLTEVQRLLPNQSIRWYRWRWCPKGLYLPWPSKALVLILVWTAVVGAVYEHLNLIAVGLLDDSHIDKSNVDSVPFALLAFAMIFFPVSGFVADVFCGRLRYVMFSLVMLLLALLIASAGFILIFLTDKHVNVLQPVHLDSLFSNKLIILIFFLAVASFLLLTIAITGYRANYLQLGLDQMLDAPSRHLALFVHLATWAYNLLATVVVVLFTAAICYITQYAFIMESAVLYSSPLFYSVILIIVLCISYRKRHWFNSSSGQHNPYKTLFKVLNFARRHKYPIQRSAFTYSDDFRPSRIDYAKERFGGPFTTEQVEDVKTFIRILVVLLTLGPVHFLQVPSTFFVFPLFGLHAGQQTFIIHKHCTYEWFLLRSGSLTSIVGTCFFPLYIWFIFSHLRNRVPRIFARLKFGIITFLLGVLSMLSIDIAGHAKYYPNEALANFSTCMFHVSSSFRENTHTSLNVHWAAFIPPNLLLGIGQLVFETTTLEFISAQSPHYMKGLLVGVYFAIRGVFQFINSITIIPISLEQFWVVGNLSLRNHPSIISCGFIYLLITCMFGLIGLILFSVATRKYKYRQRDELTFYQRDVEEIYDRYLTQAALVEEDYGSFD
jgi:peptide/histidine transporter 3/4